jgi:hypothetical protein
MVPDFSPEPEDDPHAATAAASTATPRQAVIFFI